MNGGNEFLQVFDVLPLADHAQALFFELCQKRFHLRLTEFALVANRDLDAFQFPRLLGR
jgi:hypothetical protein